MSSNFMAYKPNGIAQLFQMTKNKFNNTFFFYKRNVYKHIEPNFW